MIDFRYHLVSLISVFMALAVGVVLGAGPLQNSLGTTLNDQVNQLRQARQETQTRLEATEQAVNERDEYIAQSCALLLPGALEGKSVALVLLPQVDEQDVENVTQQIQAAGGAVTARAQLTSAWTDLSRQGFRSTYASQLAAYLPQAPTGEGNQVLGQGLGHALTRVGEAASTLMDLLTASEDPLVKMDPQSTTTADMVLVVGPRSKDEAEDATAPATPETDETQWVEAVSGIASQATTVAVGEAVSKTGLVTMLRGAEAQVTTVDSVGQVSASVSAVLALASTEAGTVSDYGFDAGAQEVMPPVSVLGVQQPPEQDPAPEPEPNQEAEG